MLLGQMFRNRCGKKKLQTISAKIKRTQIQNKQIRVSQNIKTMQFVNIWKANSFKFKTISFLISKIKNLHSFQLQWLAVL